MSSREDILKAISQNKPALVESPAMPVYPDSDQTSVLEQFIQTAELIGSKVIQLKDWQEIILEFENAKANGKFVVNTISEIGTPDVSIDEMSSSVDLEKIDLSFVRGQLGVAENSAIWVDDSNLPNRLLPFICQHLVLVVEAKTLVATMHQAYEKINTFKTGWGAFIAGPSKTADIEQSLVIGAHGARSLVIYILS
ncbi:lactate utilization protein B/C [Sphingobacteriaceae bacterium]|nr:lactate utilization protein B/C [Sphingobacteriaceae bacterium]